PADRRGFSMLRRLSPAKPCQALCAKPNRACRASPCHAEPSHALNSQCSPSRGGFVRCNITESSPPRAVPGVRLGSSSQPGTTTGAEGTRSKLTDELVEQEIGREQEFVDRVYVQLEDSARAARRLAREGHSRGQLGHEGGLVERDAMVFQAARRIA